MAGKYGLESLAESIARLNVHPVYQQLMTATSGDPKRIEVSADDVRGPGEHVDLAPCMRCSGYGFLRRDVPVDHEDFGKPVPCSCELGQRARQRALERIWESAGIPKRFATHTLESYGRKFDKPGIVADLERWERESLHESRRWVLLLTGPVGIGKSGLACALLHRALKRGRSGAYQNAPDVLSRIYASMARRLEDGEPDQWQIMKSLEAPDMLVLDDLVVGGKPLRDDAQERIWRLIDTRYREQRVSILTTNVPWEATRPGERTLRDYLWEQTWDRIRDGVIFSLTGVSQRGLPDID